MKRATDSLYQFTVEGSGEFPFDMLRYDQCWPYYGEDAAKLSHHHDERRRVVLETREPQILTPARWASFLWKVVEVGYPTEKSRTVPKA